MGFIFKQNLVVLRTIEKSIHMNIINITYIDMNVLVVLSRYIVMSISDCIFVVSENHLLQRQYKSTTTLTMHIVTRILQCVLE